MKSYQEILNYLYSQLPMFQRTGAAAYKNTLENTLALDEMYRYPHREFKSIHIAGTNGKGSASHMIASVLQEAGYRVGLYTSPHLIDFRERIRVNGEMIPEEEVVTFVEHFQQINKIARLEPSFFELTVAMAFEYFRKCRVDVAVIEVGLGGRLDSTNIITPEVSLITNISLDHTNLLGETLPAIANEKAGIIKPGVPVVVSETDENYQAVFENKANETKSPIYFADQEYSAAYSMFLPEGLQLFNFNKGKKPAFPELKTDLLGSYQRKNISGVLKTLEILREKGWQISRDDIYRGLAGVKKNTGLRGRWEIVSNNPLIICDTGHNEAGLKLVIEQLRNMAWKKLHMVIGMVNDKNIDGVLALLPPEASYYFTQANIPRALDAKILKEKAEAAGLSGKVIPPVKEAVSEARRNADVHDLIFIGGSTFVVADYFS
ncbi:bifunctional folylpolyglutamate synthase/dihydrofolate synthase [Gaoshiqia sediminis]|uniref:Dihydrofolate synthase/folylpolyglutamate synthase n=1 Tax=Gaoshiqia sediminis TaxID=2986998 RepID=A0AA42CAY2_9BACT|nr:folylpolyglutamate synthase/dihydrofolate synthase family protein [Gaoshiqia sediminis]MCW0484457.1 bifunctional folylpolyglutamate synthase/dihydrofolate synthase [Gaoshiqia sediminis]